MMTKHSVGRAIWLWIPAVVVLLGILGPGLVIEAKDPVQMVIYRDEDSFTIYLPTQGSVSLEGLRLEFIENDNRVSRRLDDFPQFTIFAPYDNVPTPICLRLERNESRSIPPLDCQPAAKIVQLLAPVDVFWFDPDINQSRTVQIVTVSETLFTCPPQQASCELDFLPSLDDLPAGRDVGSGGPLLQGLPGSPVETNSQWIPYFQTFGTAQMVLVPVGCFTMGSFDGRDNELPPHQQCFGEPFWIDQTEVTNAAYGSFGWWEAGTRPREVVNWFEARRYCEARDSRLPTEAEWEFAARGPSGWRHAWGDVFDSNRVVYGANADSQTEFVGVRSGVSWVGAFDMNGNVWEWTSSIDAPYPYSATDGRENPADTTSWRILRGGSWQNAANVQTTTYRVANKPDSRLNTMGFRCARDFDITELALATFNNRMSIPPTPTPVPVPMVQVLSGSNLRSGPGSQYPTNGSARQGQDLRVVGKANDGQYTWYQVRDLDGILRWIRADLVSLMNVTPDQIPTVTGSG